MSVWTTAPNNISQHTDAAITISSDRQKAESASTRRSTSDEVQALALWMTIKCAVRRYYLLAVLKGGVTVSPKDLSPMELERLITGVRMRAMADFIGPHRDIPAPDVNTNCLASWLGCWTSMSQSSVSTHLTSSPANRLS